MINHSNLFRYFPPHIVYHSSDGSRASVSIDIFTDSSNGIGTMTHLVEYKGEKKPIFSLTAATEFNTLSGLFNWHRVDVIYPNQTVSKTLLNRDANDAYTIHHELTRTHQHYCWSEYLGHSDMISIPYSQWCEGLFIVSAMQFKQGDALPRLMLPTHFAREYGFEKFFLLFAANIPNTLDVTAYHRHILAPSKERLRFHYETDDTVIPQRIDVLDRAIILNRKSIHAESCVQACKTDAQLTFSYSSFAQRAEPQPLMNDRTELMWKGVNIDLHVNSIHSIAAPTLFLFDLIRTIDNTIGTQFRRKQMLSIAQTFGIRACYLDFFIGPAVRIGTHPPIPHDILCDLTESVIRQLTGIYQNLAILALGEAGNFLACLIRKTDIKVPLAIFDNPIFTRPLATIFTFNDSLLNISLENIFEDDINTFTSAFWICAEQLPIGLPDLGQHVRTQHSNLLSPDHQDNDDLRAIFSQLTQWHSANAYPRER